MPYFVPGDPNPRKTPAELEAEETPRGRLDEENDRYGWFRVALVVLGLLTVTGGVIRACWS